MKNFTYSRIGIGNGYCTVSGVSYGRCGIYKVKLCIGCFFHRRMVEQFDVEPA